MNQEPRPPSMRPGRGDTRRCWSQTGVSAQHTGVSGLPHRSLRSISGPTLEPTPGTVSMPLRRRHRRLTGVSGPDRSLRTSTPESPDRVYRACAPQVGPGPCNAQNFLFMPVLPLVRGWPIYMPPPPYVNPRME